MTFGPDRGATADLGDLPGPGDGVRSVVGWRVWLVAPAPSVLLAPELRLPEPAVLTSMDRRASTGKRIPWPPRERMDATCPRGHAAPQLDCACGIWAMKTRERRWAGLVGVAYYTSDREAIVIGQVVLWGRVIGGDVLRGEFAYPRSLFVPAEAWERADELREAYGVPVSRRDR